MGVSCPDCEGWGCREYDRPVVDYINGGFIDVAWDTCETCDGSGDIEQDEDE